MAFYQKNFALVTGGSSGIGKAIAEELARRKINVLLVALPHTGLEDVAKKIAEEHDVKVLYYAIDLTGPNAAATLFAWCKSKDISVPILVNNAGLGNISNLEESSVEMLNTILLLNNYALTMITYFFVGQMKKSRAGYILNVGSLAAFLPIPRKAVYSASKSFVYSFSCSLRNELAGTGISVSCLCPGHTITSDVVNENRKSLAYRGNLFTQTSEAVAREAVKNMFRGKRKIIPGLANKFLYALWVILPYSIASAILIRIFNKEQQEMYKPVNESERKPLFSIAMVNR